MVVEFVVEPDGSISGLTVLRDPGGGLGNEALQVLREMPGWLPGIQNDRPVRVMMRVPVTFRLE